MNGIIYGFGINDVEYQVQVYTDRKTVGGRRIYKSKSTCQYYQKWLGIMQRCFSKAYLERRPTYKSVAVDERFRRLTDFIKWVDSQPNKDWRSCVLDKDILSGKSKIYSPDTCVFITKELNAFVLENDAIRGDNPIGVCFDKQHQKYRACCKNPFKKRKEYLGLYDDPISAHNAWKARKLEHAMVYANMQNDERVAKALIARYL